MDFKTEIDLLRAVQAGMTTILMSLIATHPDYRQFQLNLAGNVEIADQNFERFEGAAWKLTENQRELARAYVEHLQQIAPAQTRIDPPRF